MTVAARTLGIGLVGCGWVGRDFVAPALGAAERAHGAALYDPRPEAREAVAARVPGARVHDDLGELLADPGVDAVYVAVPNHRHPEVVEAAAAAGRHVLCEKPMAADLAGAERIVAACADAGVRYATAFDQRFHPAHAALGALIADGALGMVTAARIVYACWLPPGWAADNWRVDPVRAGGGALLDLAPHGLDLVQVLLGAPIEELAALRQSRVFGYAVEDGAMLIARLAGGALATLHVAYNHPETLPRRRLEVVGTAGLAVATDTLGQEAGGRLVVSDASDGASREVAFDAQRSPFTAQLDAFAAAVLDEETFPYLPAHDLHTMRLIEPWR